jgi:dimeric dUTPase (all-alpha-NTP-PPase superfamily)
MNDKVLLMLQLQNQLNNATNGEEWTQGITKNQKVINWRRCIYMECAEMIDSFSWKHWKSIAQEADWDNLQIEVVDVWHFIISLAIEDYAKNFKGGVEDVALYFSELPSLALIQNKEHSFASENDVMQKVEDLIYAVVNREPLALDKFVEDFFMLVSMSGLNLETLYRLYVGKNILNQFRQDHGYKEGTYIKMWNGEEDNVVMKRVWEEHGDISPDTLYKELTKAYLALTKS